MGAAILNHFFESKVWETSLTSLAFPSQQSNFNSNAIVLTSHWLLFWRHTDYCLTSFRAQFRRDYGTSGLSRHMYAQVDFARLLFMEYLRQFYPSPLHNGTFCTWSIHFNNGAFIFVKFMIISWSLAICVIMLVRRWDSFKMAVNISRADLLVLVWRLSRGSTMGIPISFFFGRWCQPLSGNS